MSSDNMLKGFTNMGQMATRHKAIVQYAQQLQQRAGAGTDELQQAYL